MVDSLCNRRRGFITGRGSFAGTFDGRVEEAAEWLFGEMGSEESLALSISDTRSFRCVFACVFAPRAADTLDP